MADLTRRTAADARRDDDHDGDHDDRETARALRTHRAAAAVPAGVEDELRRRADDAGLVDVGYGVVDGPTGPLVVAATAEGLVRVSFDPLDTTVAELARQVGPRVLELPSRVDGARRQLDEYFGGRRRDFEMRLDWRLVAGQFARQVLARTAEIPYGATSTYAEIARGAGNERASRATGSALGRNPLCVVVPCHRVLRAGGALGGYAGGLPMKRALLDLEQRGTTAPG